MQEWGTSDISDFYLSVLATLLYLRISDRISPLSKFFDFQSDILLFHAMQFGSAVIKTDVHACSAPHILKIFLFINFKLI